MRTSGVLMPVASLPDNYGIGSFSEEAYKFIDDLKTAGQSYWQILPLGPTGYGDSPYQSFSTFAGNPYFVDLDTLVEEGLLKKEECTGFNWGKDKKKIDYEKIYLSRFKVLKLAYKRFDPAKEKKYKTFISKNKFWLDDYALYMAVKNSGLRGALQGAEESVQLADVLLRGLDAGSDGFRLDLASFLRVALDDLGAGLLVFLF